MECSRLLTHVNDAITTHYDHSMMCDDAVTAPKWTSKINYWVAVKNKPARRCQQAYARF